MVHFSAESTLVILVAAVLIDGLLGEYPRVLHPVVWLGTTVFLLLKLAPRQGWRLQFLFGMILASGLCALCVALTVLVMHLLSGAPVLQIVAGAFLLKASFALRELVAAAKRVEQALRNGDLAAGREALRSLCSRDPSTLTQEELIEAAVESLAENLSDSFVAPLLYFILLGVPGAVGYRTINTLDAMVGYRGPFEALGKASARLDDLANWVPARLTAVLLLLAGWLLGKDAAQGWRILRRDAGKTPSPNAGRPMAVLAGLLEIKLEKRDVYILGDPRQPATLDKLQEARRLVMWTGLGLAGLCALGMGEVWLVNSP